MYGARPTNIQGELQVAAIEGQVKAPILGSILARVGLFLAQQLLRAKYGFFVSEKTSGVVRNGGGGGGGGAGRLAPRGLFGSAFTRHVGTAASRCVIFLQTVFGFSR